MDIKEFKLILEEKIKTSSQVFITPHVGVDFDAIASAIGFSLISKKLSRPSYIFIYEDGNRIEPGVKLITEEYGNNVSFISIDRYKKLKGDNDLLIVTDTNKRNLIGCRDYLDEFKNIIVLDHHKTDENTIPNNALYIPEAVSSTSEVMVDLLCKFGIKYDCNVANYLLAGIYLDSDKLRKGVTSKTFRVVSKLIEKGANFEKVQEFFAEDFKSDQKIQDLVQKTIFITYTFAVAFENGDTVYSKEELAKVADKLLSYKMVDASFAAGNIDDDTISISARSSGKIDVSQIMKAMDGGGNIYSAATKVKDEDILDVKKKLLKKLKPSFSTDDM